MILIQCASCQSYLWKYDPLVKGKIHRCFKARIAHTYSTEPMDMEIVCCCGKTVGYDVGDSINLQEGGSTQVDTRLTTFAGRIADLYAVIPQKLATTLFVVGVAAGLFVTVILGEMAKDGSLSAGFGVAVILFVVLGLGPLKKWRIKRRARNARQQRELRVNRLLGERTATSALEEAPWSYSRWPDGDNNYLISDDQSGEITHQVGSPEEAELWILERYLADERGGPSPEGIYEKPSGKSF